MIKDWLLMNSFIYKANNILKNDGFKVFFNRLCNYAQVKIKRLYLSDNLGPWPSLKDKYKGKRIFLLGNGPSLNQTELFLLKDEYTMCFNRVNLMLERLNWIPNFYVMTDDLLIKDMYKEVISDIVPIVDFAFFPDIHPSNVNVRKRIGEHKNVFYLNTDIPEFRKDLPNCGINKTVINAGMQIAAYLGFTEIYLLGVDMSFGNQQVKKNNSRDWKAQKDDDPNHFDPRYFGKGRSYHNPTVREMLEQFNIARTFFDKMGVKIYNAGIGGKLEAFPRVDFSNLFSCSDKMRESLFMTLVDPQNEFTSFDEFIRTLPYYDNVEIAAKCEDSFVSITSLTNQIISKVIFTHIPYGPYKDRFIYKKRK